MCIRDSLLLSDSLPLLNNRYRVVSGVGEGTFSQLLLAEDTFTQHKRVALKVMNSKYSFIGLQEVEKLCWLNTRDTHCQSHIVRLLGAFYFQQHLCLVLELLGTSLLNYMKQQNGGRVPMDVVRKIAWQLCTSLAFVGSCNMIHGDIKVSGTQCGRGASTRWYWHAHQLLVLTCFVSVCLRVVCEGLGRSDGRASELWSSHCQPFGAAATNTACGRQGRQGQRR